MLFEAKRSMILFMKSQQKFWETEFSDKSIFPGIHDNSPTSFLVEFEKKYLKKLGKPEKIKILDIGCGNGRNSLYLSKLGYKVIATDFSGNAIKLARKNDLDSKIKFIHQDIANYWTQIKSHEFDAIADINVTICIPEKGRQRVIGEAKRVLRAKGLYLFCGIARTEWVDKEPGPEVNSTIFSDSGKFEKQYTKEELLETYSDFEVLEYKEKEVVSKINNEEISFSKIYSVFRLEN